MKPQLLETFIITSIFKTNEKSIKQSLSGNDGFTKIYPNKTFKRTNYPHSIPRLTRTYTHAHEFSELTLVALVLWQKNFTLLMSPNKTKQLSTVAPFTCIVVTRVKPIVCMRVGSSQTVELSSGFFLFQKF